MLKLIELMSSREAPDAVLTLTFEQRQRSRLRVTLDDGRAAALMLARGTRLRDGDRLRAPDGTVVVVAAAPEPVTTVQCADLHRLARACYHLGNRHVALQVGAGWLRYQQDRVLDGLICALGLQPVVEQAPFEPEPGAYGHAHATPETATPQRRTVSGHGHEGAPTVPAFGAALLSLLRLTSSSLPIGSFAYSQGMEYAVEHGWVNDAAGTGAWITGLLRHVQCRQDLPLFARLYRAWEANAADDIRRWNARLLAVRESRELREEEINVGAALARLLVDLGIELASRSLFGETDEGVARAAGFLIEDEGENSPAYLTLFALACVEWRIPLFDAASGLLWSWCQNQVAAAIRLVPLGQTAGQRILQESIALIPSVVEDALAIEDDDIGFTAPGLAMASARHERQYTRLFLS